MTIVEFLLARIAEDEAVARVASQTIGDGEWLSGGDVVKSVTLAAVATTPVGHHVARHDPARVLAECQAKRAIIKRETAWNTFEPPVGVHVEWSMDAVTAVDGRHVGPDEGRRLMDEWTHPKTDTPLLRILAAVYADHPEYDPAWRP